jgi:hypothetical protein
LSFTEILVYNIDDDAKILSVVLCDLIEEGERVLDVDWNLATE